MPLYELNNIIQSYSGRPVLAIEHWELNGRTVTGVVGPNGSGKSTLLALLGFVAAPTRGDIRFNGQPAEPFADAVRGRVALLPQDTFLLKRSVYGNIAYGLQMNGAAGNRRGQAHAAMEMVGLDPETFDRRPWYALSGGEARRVALAARLALQPQVILLDEPTVSVDAASAQMIKEAALHARQQWGTTLVITSHDAEWLADICNETLHLFRGRILGNSKQTLIFGPWKSEGKNLVSKALTENQRFLAAGIPEDLNSAVAAIQAQKMSLHSTRRPFCADRHCLEGLLLRLSYERSTQRTSIAVLVGRTLLTAYLPRTEAGASAFVPGQKAWVSYNPQSVEWY